MRGKPARSGEHRICREVDSATSTHQCGSEQDHAGQHRCGVCGEEWWT